VLESSNCPFQVYLASCFVLCWCHWQICQISTTLFELHFITVLIGF